MLDLSRLRLIFLPLILGACAAGERNQASFEQTWPASAVHEVKVEDVDASLRVEATTQDKVTLQATVKSFGVARQSNEQNGGFFDADLAGNTLSIGKDRPKFKGFLLFRRSDVHVDYVLHIPAATGLEARMVNGRIAVRGLTGETQLITVNGPIDIETSGSSQQYAKTVNGRVRAVFLNEFAGASLKTVNGGVEAILPPNASFTCALSQVNGDFEASSSFPLSIHSHPGSRRVSGEVNGGKYELQISTVNGDVEVHHLPAVPAH
jgi:hypothetical protein